MKNIEPLIAHLSLAVVDCSNYHVSHDYLSILPTNSNSRADNGALENAEVMTFLSEHPV